MSEYRDQIHLEEDTLTWAIEGDAGVASTRELDVSVTRLGAYTAKVLVIDLAKCTFLSSLAMGAILRVQKALQRMGLEKTTVRNAPAEIREALTRARLDSLMDIEA